jgi:hypothetical protein
MEMGKVHSFHHVADAADVSAGTISFGSDMLAPLGAIAVVRTAAGVLVAWDGAIVVANGLVTIDNTGAVDFADTDVIDVIITS